MKKVILALIVIGLIVTGCGRDSGESEISGIIKEHLGITPYIPGTEYEIGAVILDTPPQFPDGEGQFITVNYFESLEDLQQADEEMMEWWEEEFLERELLYGNLYVEGSTISIEVYRAGEFGGLAHADIIEVGGHEVQYDYLKKGTDGRDSDHVFMVMHFDDVIYSIRYSAHSDDTLADAKELAKEIIKNNK